MDRFIVDDYVSREQELENLKSNMDRFIAVTTIALTAASMRFKIQYG